MIFPVLDRQEIHTEKDNQDYHINYYLQDIIWYLKEDKIKVKEKKTWKCCWKIYLTLRHVILNIKIENQKYRIRKKLNNQ